MKVTLLSQISISPKDYASECEIKDPSNSSVISNHISLTQETLRDVQIKIKNLKDDYLETSLNLAAEAGNALLTENTSEVKFEFQIEELKSAKEALTNRNTVLIETLHQIEHQLTKEKQSKMEIIQTFEEQDREKETIISDYEKTLNVSGEASQTLKSAEINDQEKAESTETRSPTIRKIADLLKVQIFSFHPEETPLFTTQYKDDKDLSHTCSLSFFDIDCPSSLKHSHFSSKAAAIFFNLFRFLEIAKDCIKFPSSIRELLQVILQYSCNAYLHRIQIYTDNNKFKKIIDKIPDSVVDKIEKKIGRISPIRDSLMCSKWRIAQGLLPHPNYYAPIHQTSTSKMAYIRGAMEEQKELWRVKESSILKDLSAVCQEHDISHILKDSHRIQKFLRTTKEKYDILKLESF
ncbi:hypothetical protein J6590_072836 [Homalodisca vitripennis]|nr:hypothetical protein J6590_072836 [Homalodisca vitripennis]